MNRKLWYLVGLLITALLSACSAQERSSVPPQALFSDKLTIAQSPIASPQTLIVIPRQQATPTPKPTLKPELKPTPKPQPTVKPMPRPSTVLPTSTPRPMPTTPAPRLTLATATSPTNIPSTSSGPAPYGPPPAMTAEEIQLSQKIFAQINSDRAARGLYPFVWNATLAGGARLHSWNMVHCGFSHTCPDGIDQCQRIANEGFAGYTDCGENIAYAGPYPTPWAGVYSVQEGMINEPPTGWHRIHLTSTTLHRIGVGVYVDSRGTIWFTEDMVS